MTSCGPRVSYWGRLVGLVLDLLFPPRCVACGRVDTWLCPECAAGLPRISGTVCVRCGLPLNPGALCTRCQKDPLRLEAIRSVTLFGGPVRAAIHLLKYRYVHGLAEPLGELLAGYWQAQSTPVDVIVPVPLHSGRQRRRGYNQAALLAHALGRRAGIRVDEGALRRVRRTASQMRLGAAERRLNVRGAFGCPDGRVLGQRVLLIDDVCTTGATLEACADALRAAGAEAVWALTLARAP